MQKVVFFLIPLLFCTVKDVDSAASLRHRRSPEPESNEKFVFNCAKFSGLTKYNETTNVFTCFLKDDVEVNQIGEDLAIETTTTAEAIVGQQPPSSYRRGSRRPPEQQRAIMQQMRQHITRLSQATDQKSRQVEIEGIRASLRQLSPSISARGEPTRRRQQTRRNDNIVGGPKNDSSEPFQIITQDPRLVDE